MFAKTIINSPWYFVLLSITMALALAWWLYVKVKKKGEVPAWAIYTMIALRFLSVFLISLFLLSVFFKQVKNETENPLILFAFDNSSSLVALRDSAFVKGKLQNDLTALKDKLKSKYGIRALLFGNKTLASEAGPDFSEKQTDLENLIKEVDNNYANQNIGALIIVSDGIYNKGGNPVIASEKLPYPIYTIALGDTNEVKDVAIQKINFNQVAYLGNNFPVEVLLNAKKYKGKQVNVSLFQDAVQKANQLISITSDNFLSSLNFTLSAQSAGITKYTAKVSILEDEKNKSNNGQSFVVDVINNKEKILLLASAPHPDISAIKEALVNGTNYELETALSANFTGSLKPYSLVIFHGYSTAQQAFLEDCKNNRIPFWIINPGINDNLPGIKINGAGFQFNDSEPVLINSFALFSLSDAFKKFVKDLPAVSCFFGKYTLSNGSNALLNQHIGMVDTENPILVFTEVNELKTALFLGDGLWKWNMRDFAEHKSHKLFEELISKTVQYLAVKSDKSLFRITYPKIINENEQLQLSAEVYNKSYELITEPDVSFMLMNTDKKQFNYTFSKTDKSYKLEVGILPPGEYKFTTQVRVNNELLIKTGMIAVREVVSEKLNTVANHHLLYQLAHRSGAKMYYANETKQLEETLLNNENIKPITYSQSITSALIDLKAFFWLILLLLSIEWFIRKRFLTI